MIDTPVIPDDVKFLGDRLTPLTEIRDSLIRQERPAPSFFTLNPGSRLSTTVRYRVEWLLFSGGVAGDLMRLVVGSAGEFEWYSNGKVSLAPTPLPLVFDTGADVFISDITTPADTSWRAYIIAFPEAKAEGGQ